MRRGKLALGAHVLVSMLSGCTSISWQDANGRMHHLGLVAGRVVDLPRGTTVRRWAFGADLRLGGVDHGYTLGYESLTATAPERRDPASGEELVDEVLDELRAPSNAPAHPGRLALFYFVESVSGDATLARSGTFGLGARTGPLSPGFTFGWHSSSQVIGEALAEDVVQVHWFRESGSAVGSAALWRLPAQTSAQTREDSR